MFLREVLKQIVDKHTDGKPPKVLNMCGLPVSSSLVDMLSGGFPKP